MNQILLAIGLVVFIIYAVFNIIYLIDLRKTSMAVRRLAVKTEENLNPALAELTRTLEDVRRASNDFTSLIARLDTAVRTILSVEKGIKSLYGYYKEGFREATRANVSGLKAGVKAGVMDFLKNWGQKEGTS